MSATSEGVTQGASSPLRPTGFDLDSKRRIIAQAALRVFCEKGVRKAGMRDIAKEIGISVGNLYNYFKNKDDLVSFCHDSAINPLIQSAKRIRASRDLDPREKLKRLIVEHVVALNATNPAAQIHIEMDRYRSEKRKEYEEQVLGLLGEGFEAGVFRRLPRSSDQSSSRQREQPWWTNDAKFALRVILGAVNSTAQWFNPKGPKSAREVGSEFAELLVRGIGVPSSRSDTAEEARGDVPSSEA